MDAAAEAAALRAFESANDRAATPAERKLLRDLAARLDAVAETTRAERPGEEIPSSGWGWIEAAVWIAWFADENAIPNVGLTTSTGALTELGQLYTSLAPNVACPK